MTTTPNLGIALLDGDALNDWRDINGALEDVDGAAARQTDLLALSGAAVTSVNGETPVAGAVVLDAADVGALTQTQADLLYQPAGGGGGAVDSVNGETGVVVLDAADVGAATPAAVTGALATHTALPSAHHAQAHDHTAADGSGVLSNEVHDGYSEYVNLGADAATPTTNRIRLYSKDNGSGVATLYYVSESGQIYELPTLTTGGGGGSGAPANASYVTLAAETKLSAETALGAGVIMSGTLASRPAFGTAGRLYLGTDTDLVYRDTGSAWETFATRAAGGGGLATTGGTMTGALVLQGATSTTNVLQGKLAADTQPRFRSDAAGKLEWGPGASTAPNTALYRSDDALLRLQTNLWPVTANTGSLGDTTAPFLQVVSTRVQVHSNTGYVVVGSTAPAAAGAVRLKNAQSVSWRNAANGADLSVMMNASDHLELTVAAGALTTTVGAAGGASALPATPTGFLTVTLNGTARKIPYYAT